ncbi:WxcM-like domain-containing protein [Hymenobacter sp. HMF4947]|uniref:WxcM-like domain-containing protein n=1 Tax=Hymenobacter ginkgonis TaxID=2682976 RepID=A0A7K1TFN1_9BACT|nr:FdtA/QdtA family cupin domain-containing protein [Hymenobacter ginkgonis]MVN77219.1 WxcM-like domain-containing protein [Hymenobacter ginkgonis]
MTQPYLLSLPLHGSADSGWLAVAESPHLPFAVKRVYWVVQVPTDRVRGRHAHHTLEQLLVAVHGVVDLHIRVEGQAEMQHFRLDHPDQALYLPPHCWPELHFGPGAVLLCLASQAYDAADYIHE